MTNRKIATATATALLCAGALASTTARAADWTATALALPGTVLEVRGLNNAGQVIGAYNLSSDPGSAYRGFYTGANGVGVTTLDTLGGANGRAFGINEAGVVVGGAETAGGLQRAFVAQPGSPSVTAIPLATGGDVRSAASAINASGQVAGYVQATATSAPQAAIGTTTSAGSLIGDLNPGTIAYSGGAAINASGQVAGTWYKPAGGNGAPIPQAFVTGANGVGVTKINALGSGAAGASAINDAGQVVGYSTLEGSQTYHAFITGAGITGVKDIGSLGGNSYALDVNASGQVAGWAEVAPGQRHAFITGGNGEGLVDLNSLVSFGDGTVLTEAWGINDTGLVLALGVSGGVQTAYLLKNPVPEPSTYVLMGLGLVAAGAIARRRASKA